MSEEKCKICGKKDTDGVTLKRCGRCVKQYYCSREHQKADWPNHKQFCRELAVQVVPPGIQAPPRGLSVYIEKPFRRLNERAWLHNHSEQDVYMLLIDAYRLRMDDNWTRHFQTESDNIYGGAPNSCASFLRFLRLVESRENLLPAWWSPEKAEECVALGMGGTWYSLTHGPDSALIAWFYADTNILIQLRLFNEQVYQTGIGGCPQVTGPEVWNMAMMTETGQATWMFPDDSPYRS